MEETDVQEQGSATQPVEENIQPADFSVPDAYKEAGWANNIHSIDDLWQQHANAQKLIGKKTIGIPTADSSEQEYLDFYAKTRPESVDAYDFDLEDDYDNKMFRDIFYNNGISAKQANSLINAYKDSVRQASEGLYSAEGLEASLKANIGDDYKTKSDEVTKFIRQYAKPSMMMTIDNLPNDMIGLMYGIISMTMDKYGAKELGSVASSPATPKEPDLVGYMNERAKLDLRVHTLAEEQELKARYGVGNVKG